MGGRHTFLVTVLSLLALVAGANKAWAAPPAKSESIPRIKVDGGHPLALWAEDVYRWETQTDEIYVLHGDNSYVQFGATEVRAGRVVVWVDRVARRRRDPIPVVIYADEHAGKQVRVDRPGHERQTVNAAVVELKASAIGQIRAASQRRESLANTPFFAKASAAAGKPIGAGVEQAQFVPPVPGEPDSPLGLDPPLQLRPNEVIPVPLVEPRTLRISPRTTRPFKITPIEFGKEKVVAITGGVKLLVKFATGDIRSLTVETDQVIIWKKEGQAGIDAMQSDEGGSANGVELYLTGNVVIRYGNVGDFTPAGVQKQSKTLRAERVYYDVDNHKAIAIQGDLEYTKEGFFNSGHVTAQEIFQLSETEFKAAFAEIHASRLPSDPGIKMTVLEADIYREPRTERRGLFGQRIRDRITGEVLEEDPEILEATRLRTLVRDLPIFGWPRTRTNLNDPFGPFEGVRFRQDRQFGTQIFTSWDALELIGLTKLPNESWNLHLDYLSARGPAFGTDYKLTGKEFFGMNAPFDTLVKAYLVNDAGTDILGGPRQEDFRPTEWRGRFLWRHTQEFGNILWQSQIARLSDRNFHEMYYKFEYDQGPNQETFLWVKYQEGNAAASVLVQPDFGRNWISETHWLPKLEGQLIGQSLFDRLTYHTWGSAAYARLDPYRNPAREFPLMQDTGTVPPTEAQVNGGRLDWMQQIAMPMDVGDSKIVPYGVLDLAYYSQSTAGNQQGRLYGGAGLRASTQLSRLYPEIYSEMFNLQGIYHKNTFSANYFVAGSTASFGSQPQFDRLNDDATENAVRNITPWQTVFEQTRGRNGYLLTTAPIFNPREHLVRRLNDSKADNFNDIHALQLDWRQRFQTKRGYPGLEHVIDWLTIDMSATVFPNDERDNYGKRVGFLEYAAIWNVGDRFVITSNGWLEPTSGGPEFYQVGAYFSRDDRTQFSLNYRHTDPIHSRTVNAGVTYVFSQKYAMTAFTSYDFGSQASLSNTLLFTRVGTDMQVTLGLTYNYLINTFGINIAFVPNLIANQQSGRAFGGANQSQMQDRR